MQPLIKGLIIFVGLFWLTTCGSDGKNSSAQMSSKSEPGNNTSPDSSSSLPSTALQAATSCPLPYSHKYKSTATFRVPFTSLRSGSSVKVAIKSQGSVMSLKGAWIGRYLGSGTVEQNTPLSFSGNSSIDIAVNQYIISDQIPFVVESGKRYAVSLVASGGVPAGQDIKSDGIFTFGEMGAEPTLAGDTDVAIHGLKWVAVEGPSQRVVAVLGDSIGAGMAAANLDDRFISIAQNKLGYPVVDGSVGGDGVERAIARIKTDIIDLPGTTDCLVQVGTNDLHREDPQFLIDNLSLIYQTLRGAGIRPWGATILPKGAGVLTQAGESTRRQVNNFILSTNLVDGVVDFASALADSADQSRPLSNMLSRDGIHPTSQGHQAMASAMVEAFRNK